VPGSTAAFFDGSIVKVLIWTGIALLCAFALVEVARSGLRGRLKAVWAVAIICLPVVGSVTYLVVAPAKRRKLDTDELSQRPVA
jgi:Phospholipase_D-nuclease N-terminal